MQGDACLDDDTVARFLEGGLEGAALSDAESHLASCEACMALLGEVSQSVGPEAETQDGPVPPRPPLVPGAEVGRYVVVELIGAGGMGRVYSARDPALDRKVALKLLHGRATDPSLEERLLREAKAMARLAHPEVITVHDVGRHGDQLFIAMELVDGGTLREWLRERPRPWREIVDAFVRAGRGLARAHAAGIVHRDFKPDNVLVSRDGQVRVTDFGLAASGAAEAEPRSGRSSTDDRAPELDASAPLTRTGMLIGTPAYMAPEQMAGGTVDARADVYAYCVALWEALYGERPFRGSTLAEVMTAKGLGKPAMPSSDRGVPPAMRRALLGGLHPEPGERYASMAVTLDAVQKATRASRWPWVAGAAAFAVAAVGASALARGRTQTSPVPVAPTGCVDNAACSAAHGGAAWACRATDHACVPMASEDCTPLSEPGDSASADTLWLGVMLPMKGGNASIGKMSLDGVDLARHEIATTTASLTGPGAAVTVRRIGLVTCDDSANAMRAAHHLVDDVGVPAILGFGSGKAVVDVAGGYLIGRRVLTMATLTENPTITRLPQPSDLPRLVWRTTTNFETTAAASAHFVHDILEPRIAAHPMRVALVRDDNATSLQPFGEAFFRTLVMNGKPAVENGSLYSEIAVPPDPSSIPSMADRLLAAAPSVVVLIGSREHVGSLVHVTESRWPPSTPRPAYVVGEDSTDALHDFMGTSAERRHRVFSVSPVSMPTSTRRFLMRFDADHPGEASETVNPGQTYDGLYALAYAAFAAGRGEVTGPTLARGLARLAVAGAHRVETGPTDLLSGIATLSRGDALDISGTSGALDFDPSTGEIANDFALLCPGVDAKGAASGDVESGVTFVAATGRSAGALRCP